MAFQVVELSTLGTAAKSGSIIDESTVVGVLKQSTVDRLPDGSTFQVGIKEHKTDEYRAGLVSNPLDGAMVADKIRAWSDAYPGVSFQVGTDGTLYLCRIGK